ncbi:uncharacterized protein LOC110704041 [Chenopodium quinoa]|uniref:uncharacterized protein LOC110704041 n=1 Tax=Chenopodium quinoa TaxID=63459 RepID=UPI000B799402|nr:uncharacterized protein LOC110704041 [Chenopodium quinoa]
MVEPPTKMLREYAMPDASSTFASIVRPSVQANNFELKPALIHIVQQDQFGGSPIECPLEHLANFLEKCDTIKLNGVSEYAISLRLFSFSLIDKARKWLSSKSSDPFTTWTSLSQAFLNKFFPPAKTAKLRNDITNFTQNELESLYESWERFKDLQHQRPHHGIPDWLLVQTFYNGLNHSNRSTIYATAGGALMSKTTEEANKLIEELAFNNYGCSNEISVAKKSTGIKMSNVSLISSLDFSCGNYGGAHASNDCPNFEQAQFVSNYNRSQNDPYSNTYNPGWKNYPNFSWRDQGNQANNLRPQNPPSFPQRQQQSQQERPSWELTIEKLANATSEIFIKLENKVDQLANSTKNMEVQIGQIANAIKFKNQGIMPSQTKNEKQLEDNNDDYYKHVPLKPYVPPNPFPQRLMQNKVENQYEKFLKIFKQLHVNIPFADALMQIPSYAKFLKEITSKKRKLEDYETIALSEECSDVIQQKLPPKLKDPGNFSIPCKIGVVENVLMKVDKFIIPVDFIILDMDEDVNVPIILGRPFLATFGTIIDVNNGKLTFNIGEEEVHFDLSQPTKHSLVSDHVFRVDEITDLDRKSIDYVSENTLEVCLTSAGTVEDINVDLIEIANDIEACSPWKEYATVKFWRKLAYNATLTWLVKGRMR